MIRLTLGINCGRPRDRRYAASAMSYKQKMQFEWWKKNVTYMSNVKFLNDTVVNKIKCLFPPKSQNRYHCVQLTKCLQMNLISAC